MGFDYLKKGKLWSQVTRDERFFCQHLFQHINSETPSQFVAFLRAKHDLAVPLEGEWEAGFEVCFYRDLWHLSGRNGKPFSHKRTFDLCLFGEKAIVIVEAKAAEKFDPDQTKSFLEDIEEVAHATGIENVQLVGLCSSKYKVEKELEEIFTGPILRWKDLARRYCDDEILLRADDVFDPKQPFSNFGRNSDIKLSGAVLIEAYQGGAVWWVGRNGGLLGDPFKTDILTGRWLQQKYEVNSSAEERPSQNFFGLAEFAAAVGEAGNQDSDMQLK